MSIVVSGGKSFDPPPEGAFAAVCVDVRDLGTVKSELWGDKQMVLITWELAEKMDDGRPFIATKRYNKSLHEKASLYKHLVSWRGKPFTAEELRGFDLEKLLGAPCQVVIQHAEKEGVVYGNVQLVMRAQKGQALKPSGSFVRWQDRPENKQSAPAGHPDYADSEPEEEIPF